jgi:hypothetical protein
MIFAFFARMLRCWRRHSAAMGARRGRQEKTPCEAEHDLLNASHTLVLAPTPKVWVESFAVREL